ncbi:MAG: hypothetical protein WBA74_23730, partial [Cyclobacteriaceae bacterium]
MEDKKNIRKNSEVYKVPDNYFDEFQVRMSDVERLSTPTTAFSTRRIVISSAYLVPALILIFVIGLAFYPDKASVDTGLADVSTEDLIEYLEADGITEEELLSYLGNSITDYEVQLLNG